MKEYKFRNGDKYWTMVKTEGLEQYIATDANGNDIYEGDKIEILGYIDDEGETWRFSQEVIVTAQMTNLEEIEAGLAIKAGG